MTNYMGRSTSGRLPPTGRKNSWELYVERKMICCLLRVLVLILVIGQMFLLLVDDLNGDYIFFEHELPQKNVYVLDNKNFFVTLQAS